MRRTVIIGVIAWLIGISIGVFATMAYLSPQNKKAESLSQSEIANLFLYSSELKDGFISGKIFNQNANITLTEVTIEAVPRDEKNPFTKLSPRFFNASLLATPRSMSTPFRIETGALNPEFHNLSIREAKGTKKRE